MGSRKDIIKRSLGITEYPWSSDDELEAATLAIEEASLRRAPAESRPSAADAPGPSGIPPPMSQLHQQQSHQTQQQHLQQEQQQQPVTTRRRQDRDLFWSIINSPYRISSQRNRSDEIVAIPRISHVPGSADGSRRGTRSVADVQRIMQFKRLTRNIGALRQRSYLTGLIPVTRVNPGVIVPSEANSSIIINRHLPTRLRASAVPVTPPSSRNASRMSSSPAPRGRDWPEMRERERQVRAARAAGEPTRAPAVIVHSDEDEVNNNPTPPTAHTETQPLPTIDETNEEPDTLAMEEVEVVDLGSNSTVPLEEEIVAIDLESNDASTQIPLTLEDKPGTSASFAVSDETDGRFSSDPRRPAASDATVEVLSGSSSGTVAEQCNHGTKRKHQDSDEALEPGTVKEFNQSLLRLLECPVCLEWMEPPMSQCRRGHLVCGRCRARLVSCPVCRTTFSSVRNRAMEGVSELLRYPCRHGCGREVRLRRRAPHEASCAARNYHCPAPLCADVQPMPRANLAHHFQSLHLTMMKIGRRHKFSMKVNSEQHDNWLILAMEEYFHLKIDVDIRTWGVVVYVSYIGPKCDAKNYTYEVTIDGQHNQRKLVYVRTTHSDLESSTLNVSRQDCFHLTLDQALNFIRFKNRHCDADKFLDFNLEITKVEQPDTQIEESDS